MYAARLLTVILSYKNLETTLLLQVCFPLYYAEYSCQIGGVFVFLSSKRRGAIFLDTVMHSHALCIGVMLIHALMLHFLERDIASVPSATREFVLMFIVIQLVV